MAAGCGRKEDATAARERQFEQSLTNVTLAGHFTRNDKPGTSEEKYYIQKVSKLAGETWLFHARIQYGGRDVTVPLPLTVKWAGDTPVITLTDLSIPGLGTYTARVLIYRGQYVGTWSGKKIGGQMYGQIVTGNR
ncbi:MAG: hypothetical protein HYR60_25065 [Acidobacteria bacterium]|nr:hypothetical protein [Acidobacteriota bacterium]MBI3469818.1 hypothetical protein [Candidatus Solibacter usitatus]